MLSALNKLDIRIKYFTSVVICLCICVNMLSSYTGSGKIIKVAYFENSNFQEGGSSDEDIKSGYSYEFLQEISHYTGWRYQYVYGDWAELYDKFTKGDIDLFMGLARRKEREPFMDWTDNFIDIDFHTLFVSSEDKSITDYKSLNGKRIGVVRNNNMTDEFFDWAKNHDIYPKYIYYDDIGNFVNDLMNGSIDGFIASENNIKRSPFIKKFIRYAETKEYIAVKKGDVETLMELNQALYDIENHNPGFMLDLKNKYYANRITNAGLSPIEQSWIDNNSVLRIGYTDDYMPFSSTDSDGNVTGVLKDIVQSILQELAIQDSLKVEFIPYQGQNAMLKSLSDHKIDAVFPIVDNAWYSEQTGIMTTTALLNMPMSAVFKGEYSKEIFNSIAVTESKTVQQIYIREHFPQAKLVLKESGDECLKAVLNGEADSSILTNVRLAGYLTSTEYKNLVSIPLQQEGTTYCFGIERGNINLLLFLNHGIGLIDKPSITEAMYGYVENHSSYTVLDFIYENLFLFLIIIIAVMLIVTIAIFAYVSAVRLSLKIQNDAQIEQEEYYKYLEALSRNYIDVYIVNPDNDLITTIKYKSRVLEKSQQVNQSYKQTVKSFVKNDIIPDDQDNMLKCLDISNIIQRLSQDKKYIYNFDLCVDGITHHYQMRYMYLDPNEKKTIILGFKLIDEEVEAEIERRKVLEGALKDAQTANNAKTVFLNSMSHDIRTPMNAILGYTDIMQKEVNNPEKLLEHLSKVKASGDYLLTLINNVLEVARIDSGKETLDESVVDLTDEKCSVVPLLENEMAKKHLSFTNNMNIQHRYVYADIDKIKEITMNIISNAIKYTPDGGKIHLQFDEIACQKPGYARYVNIITDNGIGMSKSFQQQIFESFTRERDTTQSKISGTGLGMAIVKKLVDMMGGQIEVESELGKGSTFKFYLEHRIAENPENYRETQLSSSNDSSLKSKGQRILLAEDNDINADLAYEILSEFGFEVDWAEDGVICVDMLTKADSGYYDLILMDIQMPNLNGYDATRKIRALEDKTKADIPIIAMTANAFEEDRKLAIECGMNNHISKPIEIPKLIKILQEVFSS